MKRIVVGVDGSAPSVAALRWALDEARAHGAEVVAVTSWEMPYAAAGEAGLYVGAWSDDLAAEAQRRLDEVVDAMDTTSVKVHRVLEYGRPAQTLLDHAATADLLVVGARGRGGFTGLLLGSVSQQCVTHAVCPTVVIPRSMAEDEDTTAG
jgi:nucleotide-binding universal stress UspA family protein